MSDFGKSIMSNPTNLSDQFRFLSSVYVAFIYGMVYLSFQGALYMRNFQFKRSLALPRIVPGKWLLDVAFYLAEFEQITFNVKIVLEVKPIGWHLFEFELN